MPSETCGLDSPIQICLQAGINFETTLEILFCGSFVALEQDLVLQQKVHEMHRHLLG